MKIKPIILAGGYGTRLWPLSNKDCPKQFLKLFDGLSSFQLTMIRNESLEHPSVIVSRDHASIAQDQLSELSIKADLIVEPYSGGTALSATLGAIRARELGYEIMVLIPSDHYITNQIQYLSDLKSAIEASRDFPICTLGIKPTKATASYGYIKTRTDPNSSILSVEAFLEKPELSTCYAYLALNRLKEDVKYFWNSGIFVCRVRELLEMIKEKSPSLFSTSLFIHEQIKRNLDGNDFINSEYRVKPISIDHALIQEVDKSNIGIVKASFSWSDIGVWEHFWNFKTKDEHNNYVEGKAILDGVSSSCIINDSKKLLVVSGLENVIVVNHNDSILITCKTGACEVPKILSKVETT